MAVKVRIPTPLRKITNDRDEVAAQGSNIAEVIEDLEKNYPGLKERICEADGNLRRFVNVYLNDEDIRFKNNLQTETRDNDEMSIIPAIAGGAGGAGGPGGAGGRGFLGHERARVNKRRHKREDYRT